MTITDTMHTTDIKQPIHTQIKKSESFKHCAVSLINKFSSSLSKYEQSQPQRHNSDKTEKFINGSSICSEKNSIKRKASTTSIASSVDSKKTIENPFDSVDPDYNIVKLCEQPLANKDESESQLQLMISPSELPSHSSTKLIQQTMENIKSKKKMNSKKAQQKNLPPRLLISHNLDKTLDDDKDHYFQQKSISTPVSSSKNPAKYTQLIVPTNNNINKNNSVHPYRYNWTNAVYNIQPMTPIKSSNLTDKIPSPLNENQKLGIASDDDDELIFTPSSCASEQWLSTDLTLKPASVKAATRNFITRCKSSKSLDITPRSPTHQQISIINQRYYLGSRSPTYDDLKLNSPTTKGSYKYERRDSLERSTSTKSSSSSSSDSIVSTSSSIFGKSEYRRKESKAISRWNIVVQRLMQKSFDFLAYENKNYINKKYTEKDQAIARFVISELYSTEKSYYQLLLFIRSNYMEPMYTASQSKNPLVKPNDVYTLFYCLPELISMSEKLLLKLEKCVKDPGNVSPGLVIGGIFKELEQDFVVFLKYAVHYQSHTKSIRRSSHNGLTLRIERESKNSKENNRLGLADYLIAPFQRVPRYGLLIKDLIKHTELSKVQIEEEDTINDLIYAQNVIDGLASTMDQVQEKNSKSPFSSSFYSSFHSRSSSNLLTVQQLS